MQHLHNVAFSAKAGNNISILQGNQKFIVLFAKSLIAEPTMRQLDLSNNFSKISHSVINHTVVLISPQPDQEGNKIQRQKILMFIYPIYNRNWRNISAIYTYNKTSIKRNILRGADKPLVRPGRKQATATENFEFHISYL